MKGVIFLAPMVFFAVTASEPQTLVRDIFSGVFFLVDDAFRTEEYIDISDVTGGKETTAWSVAVPFTTDPITVHFG